MDTRLARLDPAGHRTAALAGVVAMVVLAVVVAWDPTAGVLTAAALLSLALAVSLHVRGILSPLWPLAVVAALMPLNGLRPVESVTVGDITLILLGLVSLVVLRRARPPLHVMIVLLGTLVVTAGGTIGMIATQDWSGSVELAKFVLGAPMVIMIVVLIDPDRSIAALLLTGYATGAVISTFFGMFQEVDPAFGRASGLGVHVGHLALAAQLGFFVWLGWIFVLRSLALRLGAGLLAAICLYGVLLSGTRTALLGLVVGVLLFALAAGSRGLALLGGSAAVAVAAFFTVVPLLPNNDNIYRALGMDDQSVQSDDAHLAVLRESLLDLGQHPWTGWGFGHGQIAHNLIVQTASLGGVVALVGFLVIWGTIGLMVVQRLLHGLDRGSAMAVASFCAVVAYFVFAQFQPLIWDRHLWFFLAVTLYLQHPLDQAWPRRGREERRGLIGV